MGRPDTKLQRKAVNDVNDYRYLYVFACLVGQMVTARLRNNTRYSGIFHSSIMAPIQDQPHSQPSNSDFTIVLKYARELPSEETLSGEIEDTVIIDGKDLVSLSAINCPTVFHEVPSASDPETKKKFSGEFRTDAEISMSKNSSSLTRELEPWQPSEELPFSLQLGLEEAKLNAAAPHATQWDQFEVNERRFRVISTYQEDLYTTPLDVTSIPQSVRVKADQIAREIEASQQAEETADEEDEEARYGAVLSTGAYQPKTTTEIQKDVFPTSTVVTLPQEEKKTKSSVVSTKQAHGKPVSGADKETLLKRLVLEQLWLGPLSRANHRLTKGTTSLMVKGAKLSSRNSLLRGSHRSGMMALHTCMLNQSVVKNINALNLEPALVKLNEHGESSRNHGLSNKNDSGKPGLTQIDRENDKRNFLEALQTIQNRMKKMDWKNIVTYRQKFTSQRFNGKNFRFNPNADAFTPNHNRSTADNKKSTNKAVDTSKYSPQTEIKFRFFENQAKHCEPIHQLIIEKMLPASIEEQPKTIHPIWNSWLSTHSKRLIQYNEILNHSAIDNISDGQPVWSTQLQPKHLNSSKWSEPPMPQERTTGNSGVTGVYAPNNNVSNLHTATTPVQYYVQSQKPQMLQTSSPRQQQLSTSQQGGHLVYAAITGSSYPPGVQESTINLASNELASRVPDYKQSVHHSGAPATGTTSREISNATPHTATSQSTVASSTLNASYGLPSYPAASSSAATVLPHGNFFFIPKNLPPPPPPGSHFAYLEDGNNLAQTAGQTSAAGATPYTASRPLMFSNGISEIPPSARHAPAQHFINVANPANIVFIPQGTAALLANTTAPGGAGTGGGNSFYASTPLMQPQSQHPSAATAMQWHLLTQPPPNEAQLQPCDPKLVMMMDQQTAAASAAAVSQQKLASGNQMSPPLIAYPDLSSRYGYHLYQQGGTTATIPSSGIQLTVQGSRQQQGAPPSQQQMLQVASHVPSTTHYLNSSQFGLPPGGGNMIAMPLPRQVAYICRPQSTNDSCSSSLPVTSGGGQAGSTGVAAASVQGNTGFAELPMSSTGAGGHRCDGS